MKLKEYYSKKVNILASNGTTYSGTVNDYFFPDDNDHGMESIVLETLSGDLVEFTELDIKTITTI